MSRALAERRAQKVPVKIFKHLRSLTTRLAAAEDVHQNPKNANSPVIRVVSVLYLTCRMAGMSDPIEKRLEIEVPPDASGSDELQKMLVGALAHGLTQITTDYDAAMKAKGKEDNHAG
jgi:hypothetical protein